MDNELFNQITILLMIIILVLLVIDIRKTDKNIRENFDLSVDNPPSTSTSSVKVSDGTVGSTSTTSDEVPSYTSTDDGGLSDGAIGGIAAGGTVFVCGGFLASFMFGN